MSAWRDSGETECNLGSLPPGWSPYEGFLQGGNSGKTHGVIAGLVPAISIRMAQCHVIGMAGTSPAMTKRECHEFCPCYSGCLQGLGSPRKKGGVSFCRFAKMPK